MSNVIILKNDVDKGWNIHLHVMAAKLENLQDWVDEKYPGHQFEPMIDDLRMWHIKASWPAQDMIEYRHATGQNTFVRWPLVAWSYAGQRVSEAMVAAGEVFALSTGLEPVFAFIHDVPAKASEFVEVKGICLVQADWVPNGFLAVGRGGMQMKG